MPQGNRHEDTIRFDRLPAGPSYSHFRDGQNKQHRLASGTRPSVAVGRALLMVESALQPQALLATYVEVDEYGTPGVQYLTRKDKVAAEIISFLSTKPDTAEIAAAANDRASFIEALDLTKLTSNIGGLTVAAVDIKVELTHKKNSRELLVAELTGHGVEVVKSEAKTLRKTFGAKTYEFDDLQSTSDRLLVNVGRLSGQTGSSELRLRARNMLRERLIGQAVEVGPIQLLQPKQK